MIQASEVKNILFELGADLCGIASVDRLNEAPKGYHPCDILPSCKSVIVIAKRFPVGTLSCNTPVPYMIVRNKLSEDIDAMSICFCARAEELGFIAVPTGTTSFARVDANDGRCRAMVSAKHCAVAAGLGRIGKNTLLVTPEYGNMIWLSVILTDAELDPDEALKGNPCPEGCSICIDNCPAGALGNPEMNQGACWEHAYGGGSDKEYGELLIRCHKCRSLCPNCRGCKNNDISLTSEMIELFRNGGV